MRTAWWWISLVGLLTYTVCPGIPLLVLLMFYSYVTLQQHDSLAVALPWLLIFTLPSGLLAIAAWCALFLARWFKPRN